MKFKSALLILMLVLLPLAAHSQSATEYIDQGVQKAGAGNMKGALADFNKAIEKDPKSYEAYYNRAVAKSALRDLKGAIADMISLLS